MNEVANSSSRRNTKKNKPSITLIILGSIGMLIGVGVGAMLLGIISEVAQETFKGMSHADITYWITVSLGRFIILIISGGVAGLICGLLPYFVGRKKNNRKLGKIGSFSCIASGMILGIVLALPVAIIFSIIIWVKKARLPIGTKLPYDQSDD